MSFISPFPGSSRGGFAPRRGRGGYGPWVAKQREPVKLDVEKYPLGQLVHTIRTSDLKIEHADPSSPVAITGCEYVASYNWLNDKTPTVIVPGRPPLWSPLRAPQRLREDTGKYFRDPNAAKSPEYPIAPAVQAILKTDSGYRSEETDVFACGSTLGNLLRFVRGGDKPFRFNIEVVGDTVFFIRKENDPRELIMDVRGFGHTFPEAYTTWENDVKGSDTHQRIVTYDFGGYKCLVRFESDGYIRSDAISKAHSHDDSLAISSNGDDLLAALKSTAISQSLDTTKRSNMTLVVKRGGSVIQQHSIFDLKTRSGRHNKEINMEDIYPQLWIKQIPNFIIAYHDGAGLFSDIRVQDVRRDIQTWEKEHASHIRSLAVLLRKIVEIARHDERGLLEIYYPEVGPLEIRSQYGEGTQSLPAELKNRWVASRPDLDPSLHDVSDHDSDGHDGYENRYVSDRGWIADSDEEEPDYTACSAEDCGYCGKCTY